jgi:hypothetical protein
MAIAKAGGTPLLASADASGKVKLFGWPVLSPAATCKAFPGHASEVTSVSPTR